MTTEYYTSLIDIRKSHKILLDALMTGDRDHIRKSFENHILKSMNELLDFLKKMKKDGSPGKSQGEDLPGEEAAKDSSRETGGD
jgi:hypothetical protein